MSKEQLKAILVRAFKTFCQTAVSMIVVGAGFEDLNWTRIISVSLVAFIASMLTNIGGTPEATTHGALIFEDNADGNAQLRIKTAVDVDELLNSGKSTINMRIDDNRKESK